MRKERSKRVRRRNEEGGKGNRLTHQQCILWLNAFQEPEEEGPVEGGQEATHEHNETVIEKGWEADEAFHHILPHVIRISIRCICVPSRLTSRRRPCR